MIRKFMPFVPTGAVVSATRGIVSTLLSMYRFTTTTDPATIRAQRTMARPIRSEKARIAAPTEFTVAPSYRGVAPISGRARFGGGGTVSAMPLADTVAAALLARLPHDAGAAAIRRGPSTVVGVDPDEVVV